MCVIDGGGVIFPCYIFIIRSSLPTKTLGWFYMQFHILNIYNCRNDNNIEHRIKGGCAVPYAHSLDSLAMSSTSPPHS